MKKIILPAILIALLASCAKKQETSFIPTDTPLHSALPAQFIGMGTDVDKLEVAYSTYKPGADCDKKVFEAAQQTVIKSTGINKVNINGANIIMTFERNKTVQPTNITLIYNSDLYKAVYQKWAWSGYLMIENQNKLMSKDEFEKAVNVTVRATNTSDEAQITNKYIVNNTIFVEYAITKSTGNDPSVSYEVQTSTPINLTSQLKVNCLIPRFVEPKNNVIIDWKKGLVPTVKDLANGVKSYRQELTFNLISASLHQYIASRFFTEKVFPMIK